MTKNIRVEPTLYSVRLWRPHLLQFSKDMDYMLSIDVDTKIPSNHMEWITKRMRLDNVTVACDSDPTMPETSPSESGMVTDMK